MILSLLPINRIIVYLGLVYLLLIAIFSAGYAAWTSVNITEAEVFQFGWKGAAVFNVALYSMLYFDKPFSWLWRLIGPLNEWVFPDLNGKWDMVIKYQDKITKEEKEKIATAIIKQSFMRTSMEVISGDSDSETLAITLKKDAESSRKIMYYIYRVESKNSSNQYEYTGTAKLKIKYHRETEFGGRYYTSQFTGGTFLLKNKRKL